jgi:basic membrane protein A and related proteins
MQKNGGVPVKKLLAIIISMVMIIGVFTGCSGGKQSVDNQSKAKKRIALVTEPVGSQVFLQDMVNALNDGAKKYGYEPIIVECGDDAAFEENTRALIEEGVDLIIGGGWKSGGAIDKISTEYPDATKYALIDSQVESKNVRCITFREQEGAYLIGMIAAMVTEDNDKLFGAIHVNEGVGSWKWRYGYMEGAKAVKPDAKFVFNYVGSYNDPAKSKEYAIQQYEKGAKFINGASAGGEGGIFEAAKEKGFYTSGQDIDLTNPDNPNIVTSQLKDTYGTVSYLLERFFTEEWTTKGDEWGVAEGTIGAVHVTHDGKHPAIDKLTADEIAKLKQAAEDIKGGKINMKNMPLEKDYK